MSDFSDFYAKNVTAAKVSASLVGPVGAVTPAAGTFTSVVANTLAGALTGTVGATTPTTGAFTTIAGALTGTVGATTPAAGTFTTVTTGSISYTAEVWDDLRFPAQSINPSGAAAPPVVSNVTGMLEFQGNADNVIAGQAQMPHAWKYGTPIHFHLHLLFPTSAAKNSRWKLEYNIFPLGSTTSTHNYGTYTAATVMTVANPGNVQKVILAEWDPVAMVGCVGSSSIMWKISRLAATDNLDDDTGIAVLMEMDIHYQIDKPGSLEETPV